MSGRVVVLGVVAVLLAGAGYWLARSTASSPVAAAPSTTAVSASAPVVVSPSRPVAAPSLPPKPVIDRALAADLVDPDPRIRRAAVHEAVRDPDVGVDVLLAASRDRDVEVAGVATIALGNAYARGEVPVTELVSRAQDRSLDEKVRSSALNGLGKVASPEAITLLSELAMRGAPSERAAAAILLRNQDLDQATPVLIGLLADADAHVRDSARDSLKSRARGRDFGEDAAAWRSWWSSRR